MERTISIEDRERKDYEKEIVSLRLHEKAVIPRDFFPYSLVSRYQIGARNYGRVFVYDPEKLVSVSLYFEIEQDQENITITRIAEREYLENLSNAMMRK